MSLFRHTLLKRAFSSPSIACRSYSNQGQDLCGGVQDEKTHTGQQWDSNDYRLARFMHSPKQVNQQWAIKLIEEVPPQEVDKRVVWCDGGSGPEGHPRIYINVDKPGNHSCIYCGLRFYKKHH